MSKYVRGIIIVIVNLYTQLEMQKEIIQDLRAKHSDTQRTNVELAKKLGTTNYIAYD